MKSSASPWVYDRFDGCVVIVKLETVLLPVCANVYDKFNVEPWFDTTVAALPFIVTEALFMPVNVKPVCADSVTVAVYTEVPKNWLPENGVSVFEPVNQATVPESKRSCDRLDAVDDGAAPVAGAVMVIVAAVMWASVTVMLTFWVAVL